VIVAGGGVAGCAAALNASRAGKSVLLIEKTLLMGGLGTIGLINFFVPMCNGRGKLIIKGMCEEFVSLSRRYGWAVIPKEWQNGEPEAPTSVRYICRYSPYLFALALTEALMDAGVTILLDSIVSGAETENGVIKSVTVTNKSGNETYTASMFIDATGDADLCARADVPTIQGQNFFTLTAFEATLDSCRRAVEKGSISEMYMNVSGGRASLYGDNHPAGMRTFPGTTGEDVTAFVIENQMELLKNLKGRNPNERDITTMPTMPQLRTTRHIQGMATLTTDDMFKHKDDSVCLICDFDNRDNLYEVPVGCLMSEKCKNLLAVGRAASAEGYAWDVLRVIPPAILTGQAAGLIAAHAMDEHVPVQKINLVKLQNDLTAQNVLIHMTKDLMPEGENIGESGHAEGHI